MDCSNTGFVANNPSEDSQVITRPCLENPEIHVLAVDDSFVDRKVIEKLLKISSCKVTVVESGKRALQLLGLDEEENNSMECCTTTTTTTTTTGLNVHLIITDYSMPEMTGYDLLRKIKESSAFREVPVVIMSSENILTRIDRCLEEGAKEYIIKPVKLSDVKRIKEFIMRSDGSNEAKGESSYHPTSVQDRYLSSPESFTFSKSFPSVMNPVLLGFPCPSSKCNCRLRHLRFRNRSSKYSSGLSLQ